MNDILKTSSEWYTILNENEKKENIKITTIMDPDGWDRTNFQYSFYEEMISEKEFQNRLLLSTCMIRKIK